MQKSIAHSKPFLPAENPQETILMIDDDSDLLTLNKTILEMEHFDVVTAQSGSEALAILSKIPFPDLILLDMKMAEMSGLDFLKKLEQDRPDIVEAVPIVFMTGVDQIPSCKAAGFIRKPTEINRFLKTVRHFIEVGHSSALKH